MINIIIRVLNIDPRSYLIVEKAFIFIYYKKASICFWAQSKLEQFL